MFHTFLFLKRHLRGLLLLMILVSFPFKGNAISFALDSIATWGKFPRFVVNTYRWGDKFFNSYDSSYVVGTGTKFNVKLRTETWTDHYSFGMEPNMRINMVSNATSTVGLHLTYLAVSVGYDLNITKIFTGTNLTRKRFMFGFNCALFAADMFFYDNNTGTRITRFGPKGTHNDVDIPFYGVDNKEWGIDLYYFINNKKYSQAAAFNFSKIQKKSQGSWYFGLSYWNQSYNFNFNELPESMRDQLPLSWEDYYYKVHTQVYSLKAGYGYNWALGKHWIVCVSESPMIGFRKGNVNENNKNSIALNNILRVSAVYNLNRFFVGIVGRGYTSIVHEKESNLVSNMYSIEIAVGYRFNIW